MSTLKRGFTLLEVVLSLAILSMSLLWILKGQSDSVSRSVRSRLLTQGMHLAQAKLLETEFNLRRDGFGTFEDENCGDFDPSDYEGSERFRYCVIIEKIELPDMAMLQEKIMGGMGTSDESAEGTNTSPLTDLISQFLPGAGSSSMDEGLGKMASSFMGQAMSMIQSVLEAAVRRVTVRVMWRVAKKERYFELVSYLTDLDELDRSLISPSNTGTSGTTGTSSTGTSSTTRTTGSSSSGSTTR
ncbi:MAG: prepilin-type N-terminal cleavage/methylation domain-containing protein [Deltaproteobacteria bacterium]|nr:prepilin-type N-terminal cleavage/methylation domain-containing protein [Deltaproteobacteria bacterium]